MTAPEHLRQLALKVMTQHAGPAPTPEALAAAAHRVYDDLARVTVPLIGQLGVDTLTARALHLAQRDHSWLVPQPKPGSPEGPFAQLIVCLKQQDPAVVTDAVGTIFAKFTGLLVTLIGEPLTGRLLRKAWPDAFYEPRR
jgi:hypothetical protein